MSERLFLRLDDDPVHGPEADTPAGTLQAFAVDDALRGHVAHMLLYRESFPDGDEMVERVLPDGAVRLVFSFGDAPAPGHAAMAIGASATPALVRLRGRMEGVSVALRPGTAARLLGLPAGELRGLSVPLDALWGGTAGALLERMGKAGGDAARIALLHDALRQRLLESEREAALQQAAARAVQLIVASAGRRPLREVAEAVGVGERRLQQLFHAQVGLSPRALGRLARLHGCLRALRRHQTPDWAEVALDSGYYDQSHLANEFRALCGLTPTEFLRRVVSGSSKTTV
ncbi:AraC family transcriptional regulator [Variovorax sp. JS1663]|uniref:AraC family transcriptional regulator n=1 Tax=Variovorax sp. JS1663 TaxID=1851577 RepID=UPI000B341F27|nr:helix-turn-helix domain-containing protein [Variovorax sp. JS1663]OUM02029.1 AraC family transcriptional regulator [Variovorax sp. JS1663]